MAIIMTTNHYVCKYAVRLQFGTKQANKILKEGKGEIPYGGQGHRNHIGR